MNTDSNYTNLYLNRQSIHAYPNEFAIRTFLGGYPTLPLKLKDSSTFKSKLILDLGCGDGRNIPLFANLGMSIYGTEVSEEGCGAVMNRMNQLNIYCDVRVGRSRMLPFENMFFDFIFASGVMSFVDEEYTFRDNVIEPFRVLKNDGLFVFYVLNTSSSQIKNAKELSNGNYRIENDPFNRINGSVVRAFSGIDEISQELDGVFLIESYGQSDVNIYNHFSINVWWLVCSKI